MTKLVTNIYQKSLREMNSITIIYKCPSCRNDVNELTNL